MSRSLYEIGKAGLHQFIDALADVVSEDMTLTQEQAGGVPLTLADAEKKLLAAWDEICGRKKGERDEQDKHRISDT